MNNIKNFSQLLQNNSISQNSELELAFVEIKKLSETLAEEFKHRQNMMISKNTQFLEKLKSIIATHMTMMDKGHNVLIDAIKSIEKTSENHMSHIESLLSDLNDRIISYEKQEVLEINVQHISISVFWLYVTQNPIH